MIDRIHFWAPINAAIYSVLLAGFASAQEVDCKKLYRTLVAETTGNISICENPAINYELKSCTPPENYEAQRPASFVILALDSSGSMAGQLGGETKMDVAKREAISFLGAIQEDVPVGLVVYGHLGDNTESGKGESCGSYDWALELGSDRSEIQSAIEGLSPTGWTPLTGAMSFIYGELFDGDHKSRGSASPIIYIVSDGEETCGGDPVAAASSLNEPGSFRAVVNVVGFDVDAETRAQLEAISKAGGGKYFPAEDARALRAQLAAASKTERAWSDYQSCLTNNGDRVKLEYTKAIADTEKCFLDESYTKRSAVIAKRMQAFVSENAPEAACHADVLDLDAADYDAAQVRLDHLKFGLSIRRVADMVRADDGALQP